MSETLRQFRPQQPSKERPTPMTKNTLNEVRASFFILFSIATALRLTPLFNDTLLNPLQLFFGVMYIAAKFEHILKP